MPEHTKSSAASLADKKNTEVGNSPDTLNNPAATAENAFDAAAFIAHTEKNNLDMGPYASIVIKARAREIPKDRLNDVLIHLYKEHLAEACEAFAYDSSADACVLRTVYCRKAYNQDIFNFIVCAALIAFKNDAIDLVEGAKPADYTPTSLESSNSIAKEFKALRAAIDVENPAAPWIGDCVAAFGKEKLVKFLDSQISMYEMRVKVKIDQDDICCEDDEDGRYEMMDFEDSTEEGALGKLDALVGREDAKNKIKMMAKRILFDNAHDMVCGTESKFGYRNFVFEGPPGGGKTTFARVLAEVLAAEGAIPEKKAVFVSAKNLVDKYLGGSEEKTDDTMADGKGGVIIIDEVDSLASDYATGGETYDRAIINTLNGIINSNEVRNAGTVFVFTCYEGGFNKVVQINEGFESRFPYRINFDAYGEPDLKEIFVRKVAANGYFADDGVVDNVMKQTLAAKTTLGERFGNARTIDTIFSAMVDSRANAVETSDLRRLADGGAPNFDDTQKMTRFHVSDVPLFNPKTGTFIANTPLGRSSISNRPELLVPGYH